METTHQHDAHEHHDEHHHQGPEEDWRNEEYVLNWIERQKERAPQRARQFALVRAFIPKTPEQEFRYLNLGAGTGSLDEVLLSHFPNAQATLVDGSLTMLSAARQTLQRFGDRVEYVLADFTKHGWEDAVSGPFNLAVSTIAIHNLRNPYEIRELYYDAYQLLGHGGMFLNYDYIRPVRPEYSQLGRWAANDPDAGLMSRGGGHDMPGTLQEQLAWLSEAGFSSAEVLWKEMNVVLLCGVRDHIHMPEGHEGHDEHHHGEHAAKGEHHAH